MTRLSVIIPTYNYSRYILQAVESVLGQLEDYDELLVIDDGSIDATRSKLDKLIVQQRITYIYQENAGVSVARNHGVRRSSGDYIVFLDADDQLLDDALERFRQFIQKHPHCDLISAGRETVDQKQRRKSILQSVFQDTCTQNFYDYVIEKKFSLANGSVCIRRKVLLKRQFPEHLRVSEDFCLYAQILANHQACSFPDPTVLIQKHDDSLRHQLDYYESANQELIDTLFDVEKIPVELMGLRQRFRCQRMLSLFRAQYMAGQNTAAYRTYLLAIKCRPMCVLKLSYLRKFIRLLLA